MIITRYQSINRRLYATVNRDNVVLTNRSTRRPFRSIALITLGLSGLLLVPLCLFPKSTLTIMSISVDTSLTVLNLGCYNPDNRWDRQFDRFFSNGYDC